MRKSTTVDADVVRFRTDIQARLRRRVLEAIEIVLEEELTEALGSKRHERSDERRGSSSAPCAAKPCASGLAAS